MMPALQGLEAKPCKIAPEHRSLEAPLTLCWGLTLMLLRGETQEWSTCVHVGSHRSLKGTIVTNRQDGAISSSQWRVKALDRRKANSKSHHVWSKTTKPDRPLEVGTALSLQEGKGQNQAVWDPGVPFSVSAVIKWISASGQFAELRFTFCSLLCMHVILHVKKKKILQIENKKQKPCKVVNPKRTEILSAHWSLPTQPLQTQLRGQAAQGSRNSLVGWDCVIRIICPVVDPVIFLCFLWVCQNKHSSYSVIYTI